MYFSFPLHSKLYNMSFCSTKNCILRNILCYNRIDINFCHHFFRTFSIIQLFFHKYLAKSSHYFPKNIVFPIAFDLPNHAVLSTENFVHIVQLHLQNLFLHSHTKLVQFGFQISSVTISPTP